MTRMDAKTFLVAFCGEYGHSIILLPFQEEENAD